MYTKICVQKSIRHVKFDEDVYFYLYFLYAHLLIFTEKIIRILLKIQLRRFCGSDRCQQRLTAATHMHSIT